MVKNVGNGLNLRGARIQNVGAGSAPGDAVTYQQLTDAKRGFDLKDPVRAVAFSNITLSGTQTIDGVSLNLGDRVLVKGQTSAINNGVYVVASGVWSRSSDADENIEVTRGFAVTVLEGTTKGTGLSQSNPMLYELINSTDPVVGTDALNFAPVGAAGQIPYSAGTGINVNNGVISIDPTYSGLRKVYAATIGDASASSFTIPHNLGTYDVSVTIMDTTNNYEDWDTDIKRPTVNSVQLDFGTPPTTGQFRILVQA